MAIGYVKKNNLGCLIPETTAGLTPGTVDKIAYDCSINYGVVIENGGCGCGYVGVSCCRPITYNPAYCVGTETTYNAVTPVGTEDPSAEGWWELDGTDYILSEDTVVDPNKTYYSAVTSDILKGVLTVDCVCAESVTGGDCAKYLKYNTTSNNNVSYNIPLWSNTDTANGHREQFVSNTYPLTFNPITGNLDSKCLSSCDTTLTRTSLTSECAFSLKHNCSPVSLDLTCDGVETFGLVIDGDCCCKSIFRVRADTIFECTVCCDENTECISTVEHCEATVKIKASCFDKIDGACCNNQIWLDYEGLTTQSCCINGTGCNKVCSSLYTTSESLYFSTFEQNSYLSDLYRTALCLDSNGIMYSHKECGCTDTRCHKVCYDDGNIYTSVGSNCWTLVGEAPSATWSIDSCWCLSYTE